MERGDLNQLSWQVQINKTSSQLFPYPSCDSKFQLIYVTTREKKGHVSLDNQPVVAIANFSMTISYASWNALPSEFSPATTYFQAVTEFLGIVVVTHKSQKCNVNRRNSQLESFKMETKELPKATENLETAQRFLQSVK